MPDRVNDPVPTLVIPLVFVEEMLPEKIVLLALPTIKPELNTTEPAPANDPMVSLPPVRLKVAPLFTVTALSSPIALPPETAIVPAEMVTLPV